MEWLKLHRDIRNDAKLRSMTMAQRWIWVALLAYASEQPTRGRVEDYDPEILAVEVCDGDVTLCNATVTRFIALRMLHIENNALIVTNFEKRQTSFRKPSDSPEQIKLRVEKHRQGKRNASNAPVTPRNAPDKDIDSIVEEVGVVEGRVPKTEQGRKIAAAVAILPTEPPSEYQHSMELRTQLREAAKSLMTKGVLTKAHEQKLDGWLASHKQGLTLEVIQYGQDETAGKTGGDALDYLLAVIGNRIQNPNGRKPGGGNNGRSVSNPGGRDYRTAKQRATEETIREEVDWRASRQTG